MQQVASRMNTLLEDLLYTSKIDAGEKGDLFPHFKRLLLADFCLSRLTEVDPIWSIGPVQRNSRH